MNNTKLIEYIKTMTGQGFGQEKVYMTPLFLLEGIEKQ